MNRKYFTLLLIVSIGALPCWGFRLTDQPQTAATPSSVQPAKLLQAAPAEKKAPKIAFVDMEKIFNEFPETKTAKEQLDAMVNKGKEEIVLKEQKVKNLKAEIVSLSVQPSSPAVKQQSYTVQPSSPSINQQSYTVPPSSSSWSQPSDLEQPVSSRSSAEILSDKQAELKQAQDALDKFIADTEQRLTEWESKAMRGILGKFYQSLRKIAEEENFSIIVDKNSVLYGEQGLDITDRLQKDLEKAAEELIEIEENPEDE
ncbi:MAG: OmpH family outer membrane protein [Elusimicrobiota bacterium]